MDAGSLLKTGEGDSLGLNGVHLARLVGLAQVGENPRITLDRSFRLGRRGWREANKRRKLTISTVHAS
jgi:hypothetical protein